MAVQLPLSAKAIIDTLELQRHPEGGWYKQTFKDENGGPRGHSTAIYYLLERGERSHWHRVRDAVEIWHFYAGAPMALSMAKDSHPAATTQLGANILLGETPQAVVPAGWWQSATTRGAWSLVGCTVSPGFDFDVFEMAPAGWEPPQA